VTEHTRLRAEAERWLSHDPDPATREAIRELLTDEAALADHFGGRLAFGTAGLRGPLGPGPKRMNRALVRRVSAGLGRHVLEHVPEAAQRGVVVGFDARHGSQVFAEDTAAVLCGLGFRVYLFGDIGPTPRLAYAVLHLNCAAGVMVTASHNPPKDNGYKVFWSNGAQIVAPQDAQISACIDAVDASRLNVADLAVARLEGWLSPVPPEVETAYRAGITGLRSPPAEADLKVVYTAMHGVGYRLIQAAFADAGYAPPVPVVAQVEPDPDFPTVAFPNPEEPGAMDLALARAVEVGADLVVASDPDADRLAIAVPVDGGWRALTGNEIGCLLADERLIHGPQEGDRLVVNTIVSSALLGRIAEGHGARCARTLTGFKWIASRALAHEAEGGRFVMGYEEALGYCIGDLVRDKDGVSAAVAFCDLAQRAKSAGRGVLDRLADIYRAHGVHLSAQRSLRMPGDSGAARIQAIMRGLRDTPPAAVGDATVASVTDYAAGAEGLPPSNVLAFELETGARILARPSGTEPKVKFYFEVRAPMGADEPLAQAEARSRADLDALAAAWSALVETIA
jgi:phosphomannomutase